MVELTMLSALSRVAYNLLNKGDNQGYAAAGNTASGSSALAKVNARSLLELGRVTEVEAITVVDTALTVHESTTDVLKFANTLYASWYLSAAAVLTDTGRVRTVDLLTKLNPSKSPSYAVANSILSVAEKAISTGANAALLSRGFEAVEITSENVPTRLPRTVTQMTASLEAAAPVVADSVGENKGAAQPSVYVGGMRNANDLATVANLSIGQAVTLTVTDGKARDRKSVV